jgi:hypothetical protein
MLDYLYTPHGLLDASFIGDIAAEELVRSNLARVRPHKVEET